MSCKKPVLLAIDGVSRELVEEAQCGLYIEQENANDFRDKVMRYVNNPDLAITHGVNGYNYAKKHFDRKVLAESYLTELEKVVK